MYINSVLKMQIHDLEITQDEIVAKIVESSNKDDYEGVQKEYKEYQRVNRLISFGYEMILDGKLEQWDWKWLYKRTVSVSDSPYIFSVWEAHRHIIILFF